MAPGQDRVRRRGSGLRARLRRLTRLLLCASLLVLAGAWPALGQGDEASVSRAPETASVCDEAQRLIGEGQPSAALTLIERHRGTDAAASTAALGVEAYRPADPCASERERALVRIQHGAAYAALAAQLGGVVPSDGAGVTAGPATQLRDCPEPRIGEVLTAEEAQARAESCDRTNVQAEQDREPFLPALATGWASARKNVLTPLGTLLLPAALVALAILVAARLVVPLVPSWPRLDRARSWPLLAAAITAVAGASLCLVAALVPVPGFLAAALAALPAALLAICLTDLWAKRPGWLLGALALFIVVAVAGPFAVLAGAAQVALLLLGAVLALVGVWLVALEMATRLRMSISVKDAAGGAQEADLTHLVALLEEMGGDGPRGLEVPRGADVTALTTSVIAKDPSSAVLKALWSAWSLLVSASPWLVQVDTDAQKNVNLVMTRNGRPAGSAIIRTDDLGQDLTRAGTTLKADPYRFVAAAVLVQLARHHDLRGLYGVTSWKSLGLHCLATIDLPDRTQEEEAKALLTLALHHQPDNLPAQLALERLQHRKATTDEELRSFGDWLRAFIGRLDHQRLGATPLALRAHYLYVTSLINRRYGTCHGQALGLGEAVKAFGAAVAEAGAQRQAANDDVSAFIDRMDAKVGWVSAAYLGSGSVKLGESTPAEAYSAACYLASQDPPDTDKAVRLLRIADRDPELADWRPRDPQLERLRGTEAYRRAYPRTVRTDILELEPLAAHAHRLRELGLVDTEALLAFAGSETELASLIRARPDEARRVIDTLGLVASLQADPPGWDEVFPEYAVEVVHELLARGVVDSSTRKAWAREHASTLASSITLALADRLDHVPLAFRSRLWRWLRAL